MDSASIFVSPALYEPFGLAVLEAANAGCALLLADIPSFRELWDDAALFVDVHDGAEILSGLQSLCRDELLRAKLQRAATERALEYSVAKMVKASCTLYTSLIAPASRMHEEGMLA